MKTLFFRKFSYQKPIETAHEAIKHIKSNMTISIGGFGLCGVPTNLIHTLSKTNTKDLTVISNDAGIGDQGLGLLLAEGKVRKLIASYVGESPLVTRLYQQGELELELVPQGTLAERLRAGGAGIPAFYTAASAGTIVAEGKFPQMFSESKVLKYSKPKSTMKFNHKHYVLEKSLQADIALIKGHKADPYGNVVFRGSARNFNPAMAKSAKHTIIEVDELVELGELRPEEIHLPGIYTSLIVVKSQEFQEDFGFKFGKTVGAHNTSNGKRQVIAERAAKEFKNGMYVNLGIGIPTLAANFVPSHMTVHLQSENGILGLGPVAEVYEADKDYINAGKVNVKVKPGASVFCSDESFSMIRGGHIDLTFLGALQVSENGDLANWIVPGKMVCGMGGAMDLATGGAKVIVLTTHTTKDGKPKLKKECSLPLTAKRVVHRIITELCVFDVKDYGLELVELTPGVTVEEVREKTECTFKINLK